MHLDCFWTEITFNYCIIWQCNDAVKIARSMQVCNIVGKWRYPGPLADKAVFLYLRKDKSMMSFNCLMWKGDAGLWNNLKLKMYIFFAEYLANVSWFVQTCGSWSRYIQIQCTRSFCVKASSVQLSIAHFLTTSVSYVLVDSVWQSVCLICSVCCTVMHSYCTWVPPFSSACAYDYVTKDEVATNTLSYEVFFKARNMNYFCKSFDGLCKLSLRLKSTTIYWNDFYTHIFTTLLLSISLSIWWSLTNVSQKSINKYHSCRLANVKKKNTFQGSFFIYHHILVL